MKTKPMTVSLENPWTGEVAPEYEDWTFPRIAQWARENIHESDVDRWIAEARVAFRKADGETLGKMIIGS